MSINAKVLLFFSFLMALLVLVLASISLYSFYHFSLYTAERHALSVAETIKVGLTESMVNGTIGKRPQYLDRLVNVPGVESVKVTRSNAVVQQFGPGLERERQNNSQELQVLVSGQPLFASVEKNGQPYYRATIPYIANNLGTPNCLQCHQVSNGTVLGAVTIDIPLGEVKRQGVFAAAMISLSVALTALLTLFLLRRQLRPLEKTAASVKTVVAQAISGEFHGRVEQHTMDEVGQIAGQVNRLMAFLDEGINNIGQRVGELMKHPHQHAGNQMVTTTEMVEGLVEASQFKQAIEEDLSKQEVYDRLSLVLSDKFDFSQFSIYEIQSNNNRITPVIVDGESNAPCRWCDQQILVDAGSCRVRRTGHEVNGIDFPGICTMFRGPEDDEQMTHICLPITQSGSVGCVVQILVPKDGGQLAKLLLPFIGVYLRESAPVLEAKRLMESLKESALRDAMTGLYNRRFLEEYVTTLVSSSQRRQSPFSVLMLDLDYFKQVNDTYGHEVGDKVLKTVSEILLSCVRTSDMTVRYGGEEFLVLLQDSNANNAMMVAEKIRQKVEETQIAMPGAVLQKTISIGVAEFPGDSDTFWQVVKFADVALYEAKHHGRNQVVRFKPEMWSGNEQY